MRVGGNEDHTLEDRTSGIDCRCRGAGDVTRRSPQLNLSSREEILREEDPHDRAPKAQRLRRYPHVPGSVTASSFGQELRTRGEVDDEVVLSVITV
jgi:hypothetical protein